MKIINFQIIYLFAVYFLQFITFENLTHIWVAYEQSRTGIEPVSSDNRSASLPI